MTADTASRSTLDRMDVSVGRQPFHPILVPFAIACVTGVFVTHRMRDAFTLASEYATNGNQQITFQTEDDFLCIANTRFLMLRDGKIIFEGPDEVLRWSDDEYIKRFLA